MNYNAEKSSIGRREQPPRSTETPSAHRFCRCPSCSGFGFSSSFPWQNRSPNHTLQTAQVISPVFFSELCKRRVGGPSQLSVSTLSFSGDGFSFLGRQLWLSHIKAFDGKSTGNLKYIWLEGNSGHVLQQRRQRV